MDIERLRRLIEVFADIAGAANKAALDIAEALEHYEEEEAIREA